MAWLRWLAVPAIVFMFDACSLEATDTGGETNWLHCERDDDCGGSGSCIEQRCMSTPDAGSSTEPAAGSGGANGSGGMANSAGSGGTASTAAGAAGASGAAGSGGSASGGSSNGGSGGVAPDLVATWAALMPNLPEGWSDPEHDGCWDLTFTEGEDGKMYVQSRLSQVSPDLECTVSLRFAYADQDGEPGGKTDQVLEVVQEVRGPVQQHFGPDCMTFGDRQVACDELDTPLSESGIGEGSWFGVVCMPADDGGCDCATEYWGISGKAGTWALMDDRVVLTRTEHTFVDPIVVDNEVTSDPIEYTVTGDTLRFGTAVDTWWNNLADVDLTRIDCADGVQGPGEIGIDCGYHCPTACLPWIQQ